MSKVHSQSMGGMLQEYSCSLVLTYYREKNILTCYVVLIKNIEIWVQHDRGRQIHQILFLYFAPLNRGCSLVLNMGPHIS